MSGVAPLNLDVGRQTLLSDSQEIFLASKIPWKTNELSTLAGIFTDIVSPETIRAAHERFFPYRGIAASRRKVEDLNLFMSHQDPSLFRFSKYYTPFNIGATATLSALTANHFIRSFKLTSGKLLFHLSTTFIPAVTVAGFTSIWGYNYLTRYGLPDCPLCHNLVGCVAISAITGLWPLVSSALMGIHVSHLTSARIVPVDIYKSKTSFLKAVDMAKDFARRGKLGLGLAASCGILAMANYYAMEKQYEEFITLFALACKAIETPSFPSDHRKPLLDPSKLLVLSSDLQLNQ